MNERLLFELYSGARDLSVAEFGELAFSAVRNILPVHSGILAYGSYDTASRVTMHAIHRHNVPIERLFERAELPWTDPAILNSLANPGRTAHTDALAHARHDAGLERYLRRYDVSHALTLIPGVPVGTPTDGITLWSGRLKRGVSFTDLAARADEVLPHLLLANSINRRLRTGDSGPASAVAALDGVLLSASPATHALLSAGWPDWHPPLLPKALLGALLDHQRFESGTLSVTASVINGLLFLKLTRRAAPVLTAAERRVAMMAVHGATYKEIARDCGVSPSTVRNQLHAVYAKYGLRNKTELARVLADG